MPGFRIYPDCKRQWHVCAAREAGNIACKNQPVEEAEFQFPVRWPISQKGFEVYQYDQFVPPEFQKNVKQIAFMQI